MPDSVRTVNTPPNFSLESLQAIIEDDFPDFRIEQIKFFDESWDNVVLEINGQYIFRFPKDNEVNFFTEVDILERLRNKVTLAIPHIGFIGKSFTYSGYRKIPGSHMTHEIFDTLTSAEKERFISDLAQFLKEIHDSVSIEEAEAIGVPQEDPSSYVDLAETIFSSSFKEQSVLKIIRSTIERYKEMMVEQGEQVFLYNDLHTENMAFDLGEKKLNGIYDFGDVAMGDINRDFYPLYKFDPALMRAVMGKYASITNRKLSEERAAVYAAMNEVCDLAEFIDKPDTLVYQNAVKRLSLWDINRELEGG